MHHKESRRNKKEEKNILNIVERLATHSVKNKVKRDYGSNVSLDKKSPRKQGKKSLLVTPGSEIMLGKNLKYSLLLLLCLTGEMRSCKPSLRICKQKYEIKGNYSNTR